MRVSKYNKRHLKVAKNTVIEIFEYGNQYEYNTLQYRENANKNSQYVTTIIHLSN